MGLDLGTSKISVIVCELSPEGSLEIIGVAEQPANGMKRGMIANIDQTVDAIQSAVNEAEMMASCEISGVFAGITGSHIRSYNSTGVVAIRGSEVRVDDVNRVIEAAQAVKISSDEKILHVLPQAFIIDDQEGINDPLGLSGVRLEANVHVVICNVSAVNNVLKCIQNCDLEVENLILHPIASGYSVLTEDERDLGVGLLDIGDGTADLAVYWEGEVHHSLVLPVGGSQVTKDIAVTLHTPTLAATKIKHQYGSAVSDAIGLSELIELPSIGGRGTRTLPQHYLAKVIEARLEEIFHLANTNLIETNYKQHIRSGLVLTGGTSKIANIETLAERIFQIPIRLAAPRYKGNLDEIVGHPKFATGVGLCEFGLFSRGRFPELTGASELGNGNYFTRFLNRIRGLYTQESASTIPLREPWRPNNRFQGEFLN